MRMAQQMLRLVGVAAITVIGIVPIFARNLSSHSDPGAVVPEGLVGWWSFDNCMASDRGPLQRITRPKFANNKIDCVPGVVSSAFRFRGVATGDHIEVVNEPPLKLTEGFTINLWFRLESNLSYDGDRNETEYGTQVLISKSDDRTGLSLRLERWRLNGRWYVYAANGRCCSFNPKDLPAIDRPELGVSLLGWHMVTLSFSPQRDEVRLYLDGQLGSEMKGTVFDLNPQTDTETLTLGADRKGIWYPFNGSMDEVRVYDRAISAKEVMQLYSQPTAR